MLNLINFLRLILIISCKLIMSVKSTQTLESYFTFRSPQITRLYRRSTVFVKPTLRTTRQILTAFSLQTNTTEWSEWFPLCDSTSYCLFKYASNSICKYGFCKCPHEFPTKNGFNCERGSKFFSFCPSTEQCQVRTENSICQNSKCICPLKKPIYIEAYFGPDKCVDRLSSFYSHCDYTAQCTKFDFYSSCKNGACKCQSDYLVYNPAESSCVRATSNTLYNILGLTFGLMFACTLIFFSSRSLIRYIRKNQALRRRPVQFVPANFTNPPPRQPNTPVQFVPVDLTIQTHRESNMFVPVTDRIIPLNSHVILTEPDECQELPRYEDVAKYSDIYFLPPTYDEAIRGCDNAAFIIDPPI